MERELTWSTQDEGKVGGHRVGGHKGGGHEPLYQKIEKGNQNSTKN